MADRKCVNCVHLEVCAICKPWPFDQGCDNYLELVRCKDCKHWYDGYCCNPDGLDISAKPDAFCSCGAKMNGGKDK